MRARVDYAFGELCHETLAAGARVTNPASRRVLEKCGFQWTGVGLIRIRAINSRAGRPLPARSRIVGIVEDRGAGCRRVA